MVPPLNPFSMPCMIGSWHKYEKRRQNFKIITGKSPFIAEHKPVKSLFRTFRHIHRNFAKITSDIEHQELGQLFQFSPISMSTDGCMPTRQVSAGNQSLHNRLLSGASQSARAHSLSGNLQCGALVALQILGPFPGGCRTGWC